MNGQNEMMAFLVRETGWSLEYIRQMPLTDLYCLVNEISYQKQLEEYHQQYNFAMLMATMINLWGKRKVKPQTLMGSPPKKQEILKKEDNLWKVAEREGVKIPLDRS